jgi:hypothetical protein
MVRLVLSASGCSSQQLTQYLAPSAVLAHGGTKKGNYAFCVCLRCLAPRALQPANPRIGEILDTVQSHLSPEPGWSG